MMRWLTLGALLFAALSHEAWAENAAADQQWGDLTGRFIFDGDPPKPVEMMTFEKDKRVVKEPIFSESALPSECTVRFGLPSPKSQVSFPGAERKVRTLKVTGSRAWMLNVGA